MKEREIQSQTERKNGLWLKESLQRDFRLLNLICNVKVLFIYSMESSVHYSLMRLGEFFLGPFKRIQWGSSYLDYLWENAWTQLSSCLPCIGECHQPKEVTLDFLVISLSVNAVS